MRSSKCFLWAVVITLGTLSCQSEKNDPTVEDLSEFARNYLGLKIGSMNAERMASSGVPGLNAQNKGGISSGRASGRMNGDSTQSEKDTTYYPFPWTSCGIITTTENPDGSTTTSYDYGDGCTEGYGDYQYTMFGKYTYTWKDTYVREGSVIKTDYYSNYSSENYGGIYYWEGDTTTWSSNGKSEYSGYYEYDTLKLSYKGNYVYSSEDTYTTNGISYSYNGEGKGSNDENGSITEVNTYTYSTTDYYYNTYLLEPLVTRYDCYNSGMGEKFDYYCMIMPIPVSGREFITYKDGDKEGSFEIDYGDGECDSKITIIENGNRIEVDLYSDMAVLAKGG